MNPEIPQLSCLVLTHQEEHHKLVSTWLGVSKRVGSVTAVESDESLCKHLSRTQCQLCVIVLRDGDASLPACVSSHPEMRVLVLTCAKSGNQTELFQQGATDVVCLQESAEAQHAISRLIDDCIMQAKMRFLETHTQQLEQEVTYLQTMLESDKRSFAIDASNDNKHRATLQLEKRLQKMKQPVIENIITSYKSRDAATGLPARTSVLERFQKMLLSDVKAPRFTAMLVRILTDNKTDGKSGADKTVQDLTLYRAADALQKRLAQGTILGRIDQNALLLIQSSDIEPASRDAANRVRDTLGSLGGLINSATDVHINTMNLPVKTRISADEVVERLEALG